MEGSLAKTLSVFKKPEIESEYQAVYQAALDLWPVPFDEFYLPTRFGDTHVIASGSKESPPLLLFQPAGAGAAIWYRNAEALSPHFRLFAVDTIGEVNRSILSRPITRNLDFLDWISDLFASLQIESADIVGNSFGGFLTLLTALHLPDRVHKAVLISPAASFMTMWPSFWHLFIPAHVLAPRLHSEQMVLRSYAWIWQGFPADDCIQHLRHLTALNGLPHHGPPTVFTDDELRRIQTPMLLLIGDHETIYPSKQVIRRATRLMPNLKAAIVPNANHNAQYTAPEFVNQKILEFLSRTNNKDKQ